MTFGPETGCQAMNIRRSAAIAFSALGLTAAGLATVPATVTAANAVSIAMPRTINGCVTSVPEPGTTEPVEICYSIFKPAKASRKHKVPFIMHSHGWGGSRTTTAASFQGWLDRGYAVLSFDQRGWGQSGGYAHVEHPDIEGRDIAKLIRKISRFKWTRMDGRNDPRLGAIGGSYGGGYQFLGAFTSLQRRGKPVFDALAPEITWNDLNTSLAPEGVVRTSWAVVLTGVSPTSDALEPKIYKALVEGAATGTWPDGSIPGTENLPEYFKKNGPKWHVDHGRRLDIPVLFGQGTTDGLFNLREGLLNWQSAITRRARKHSIFVGYNGGHVLPSVTPMGINVTSDPCSKKLAGGSFSQLSMRFMDEKLKGKRTGLRGYGKLHFATPESTCTSVTNYQPNTAYAIGDVVNATGVQPTPVSFKVADGPLSIAGSAYFTGDLTALGLNNRMFYGLAVGTNPLDATLIQNNMLPVNELLPVEGVAKSVVLPSVAIDIPAGQSLFLMVAPDQDTFATMGSRTPGAMLFSNTVVHLPVVGR